MAPNKTKPILNEEELSMLKSALADAGPQHGDVDNSNVNSVVSCLLLAFLHTKKKFDEVVGAAINVHPGEAADPQAKSQSLAHRLQVLEDELDETRQRNLKGNLFLTSRSIPAKSGKPAAESVIKSDLELGECSLTNHVLNLIQQKYEVIVPEVDVSACHRLPHGAVILRIWNRKPGSAWSKLVSAIKSKPVNKSLNFFANFHLTSRRMKTSFLVRQLKYSKSIHQYYTDENGSISIKVKESDKKKTITFHRIGKEQRPVLALTENEIKKLCV